MEVYNSSYTAEQLEYALGAVPSIGENGNWYIGDQDTGVFAGGVNVSGAEVGQFVKIASVDSNGRPTSWTPFTTKALTLTGAVEASYDGSEALSVEIPSGGNEWTLLADVTLTEAVRTVDLAIDAVNCKEIFILQNVSCGESSIQGETVYISGEKSSIARGVIGGLPIVKNTGYYAWSAIRLKIDAGRVFSECVYSDTALPTPGAVNVNLGYGKGTRYDNVAVIEETAFKAIRLQCTSDTVTFSADSSFKVWGR